jgi:hypothetical protein
VLVLSPWCQPSSMPCRAQLIDADVYVHPRRLVRWTGRLCASGMSRPPARCKKYFSFHKSKTSGGVKMLAAIVFVNRPDACKILK